MMKPLYKTSGMFFALLLSWIYPAIGQITNQSVLTIQSGTQVTVQGDLVNDGNGEIALEGKLSVDGNITNNSSANLTSGAGETILKGSSGQTIGGSTLSRFGHLTQNNANGTQLNQSIEVDHNLTMQAGTINLNGQTLDLGDTGEIVGESNTNRIFGTSGKIQAIRDLNAPAGANIAGMGVAITSGANLGMTTIERSHASMAVGAGTSIDRTFDIDPANNTSLSAMLRIDYFDAELNGQDPNLLKQFRKSPGATDWTPGFVTNSGANFVEGGPYNSMALWTLSADGTSAVGDLLPAISVKYYPNPVQNGSQIFVEGLTQGKYDFVLFDMRGRKVWEKNSLILAGSDMETFRLPNLAEGVYSLHIIAEGRVPTTGLLEIQ